MKFPKIKSDIIKIDTLIGKRANITGDINGKGNFKIDGAVTGNITVKGDIVTGDKSEITGDIVAKNVIIAGIVTGNVEASGQLTIKHSGTITGDQKCGSLIIEEGSSVKGKCEISGKTDEDEAPDIKADEIEEADEDEALEENEEVDD